MDLCLGNGHGQSQDLFRRKDQEFVDLSRATRQTMAEPPLPTPALTPPKQISRHIFAVLALLALGAAVGLWYLFNQTTVETLKLGAGMELKYREGLTDILCDEAESRDLKIEIQWNHQALDAIRAGRASTSWMRRSSPPACRSPQKRSGR